MASAVNHNTCFGFEKREDGVFKRACVFPGACLHAMQHCKYVIGLDGTHLKGNMNKRGVVLLATTNDLEGQVVVFGLALVEKEDYDNWSWFKLADTRKLAVEYLNGIEKSHWVTYAFSETYNQPSYDEVTSNLSEAANNWLGTAVRSSYPLSAFEQYFIKIVELFAERRRKTLGRANLTTRAGSQLDAVIDSQASDNGVIASTRTPEESDFNKTLLPVFKKKTDGMMAFTKRLLILPCLDGQYMVRFTDISTRPDHAHMWRAVNLIEKECTCRRWQDEKFPYVRAVNAAIHHGMYVCELFAWADHSLAASRKKYYYQFIPMVRSATITRDPLLLVPEVIVTEEDLGSRGNKPGPKPKHKRRSAPPGSASTPAVTMTQ